MRNNLKFALACLLALFASYCAGSVQAQSLPKYERDFPPEPVKVLVENGNGEVQIVFKWNKPAETPPTGLKITYKVTDAAGTFNTIKANDITFKWDDPLLTPTPTNSATPAAKTQVFSAPEATPTPTPAPILVGRLKVENLRDFNDFSAPYTGYVVFFSNVSDTAPVPLRFELHRKRLGGIASYLENITLPGTNFFPSFLNPLFAGLLLLVVVFLLASITKDKKVLISIAAAAVIILVIAMCIGLSHNPGPKYSGVYIDSLQLTQGRNDQSNFPAKEIGILTSDKSGSGKMYLEKKDGEYFLTFRDLPRAGEYNGKIPAEFISTAAIPVKVKVADWLLYFFVTVLAGILATHLMTLMIPSPAELNTAMVMAGGSVLAVLVTHFALYTDTWGSTLDYVKVFAAGAGVNLATKYALTVLYRITQRW